MYISKISCFVYRCSIRNARSASDTLRFSVRSCERNAFLASCCVMVEPPSDTPLRAMFTHTARRIPTGSMP